MIDNTFASPINQTPADFGIDSNFHSATKYMGGHSVIFLQVLLLHRKHILIKFGIRNKFWRKFE